MSKISELKIDVQGMRDKILDLAMRGKLVSQDENDEPASVLLEKIAQEKEQLIKEKKIKKTKPLPEITDEEKPFDIPDSWEWVRLGEVSNIFAGSDKPADFSSVKDEQHPFEIFSNGIANAGLYGFTKNARVYKKSLTISARGTIGHVEIRKKPFLPIIRLITVTPYRSEIVNFLGYYLTRFAVESEGSSIPQLTVPKLKPTIVPLPPLNEQKRIAAKVEELFSLLGTIEESTKKYESLQIALKEKILKLGMKGKLVEQDSNEESADKLFEKIQVEKAQLIKEKKIKKTKPLAEITDKEKPFSLPNNWKWVRMGNIINLISGRDIPKKKHLEKPTETSIPYITGASNFLGNGKLKINEWIEKPQTIAKKETLLISVKGTIGKMAVLEVSRAHIARQIMGIENIFLLNKDFQKYFLKSYVEQLKKKSKSMIPGIAREDILLAPFPLPPLNEQKRIATEIDSLFSIIDN